MRTSMEGTGVRGAYQYLTPSTSPEIYSEIGILFTNGMHTRPQIDVWFQTLDTRNIITNDDSNEKLPNGECRLRHFCQFLTFYEPHTHPIHAHCI